MKDNKSITTNGYIDLDLVETANNILIIGNTTGFTYLFFIKIYLIIL